MADRRHGGDGAGGLPGLRQAAPAEEQQLQKRLHRPLHREQLHDFFSEMNRQAPKALTARGWGEPPVALMRRGTGLVSPHPPHPNQDKEVRPLPPYSHEADQGTQKPKSVFLWGAAQTGCSTCPPPPFWQGSARRAGQVRLLGEAALGKEGTRGGGGGLFSSLVGMGTGLESLAQVSACRSHSPQPRPSPDLCPDGTCPGHWVLPPHTWKWGRHGRDMLTSLLGDATGQWCGYALVPNP